MAHLLRNGLINLRPISFGVGVEVVESVRDFGGVERAYHWTLDIRIAWCFGLAGPWRGNPIVARRGSLGEVKEYLGGSVLSILLCPQSHSDLRVVSARSIPTGPSCLIVTSFYGVESFEAIEESWTVLERCAFDKILSSEPGIRINAPFIPIVAREDRYVGE